jgi:hypothetical protein
MDSKEVNQAIGGGEAGGWGEKENPALQEQTANRRRSYVPPPFYHPRDETPLEHAVDEAWEEASVFAKKVCTKHADELVFHPPLTGKR